MAADPEDQSKESKPVIQEAQSDQKAPKQDAEPASEQPEKLPDDNEAYSIFTTAQKKAIVLTASLCAFFSPTTGSIYYPALNVISHDLHVSNTAVNLTVTTYLVSFLSSSQLRVQTLTSKTSRFSKALPPPLSPASLTAPADALPSLSASSSISPPISASAPRTAMQLSSPSAVFRALVAAALLPSPMASPPMSSAQLSEARTLLSPRWALWLAQCMVVVGLKRTTLILLQDWSYYWRPDQSISGLALDLLVSNNPSWSCLRPSNALLPRDEPQNRRRRLLPTSTTMPILDWRHDCPRFEEERCQARPRKAREPSTQLQTPVSKSFCDAGHGL